MNNNILNCIKKFLSVALALALLVVSLFTGVSINTKAAETEKTIIYWDGMSTPPDETKKDSEGNIFIYTAAELHYIANTKSSGYSYKMADGIDVIILQLEDSVDAEKLMGLTDYSAVKTYLTDEIDATAWCNYSTDPPVFNGSFDGNGVEIYGLYGTGSNVGLFPGIDGGANNYDTDGHTGNTFQNFALRNSYLESSRRIGVIGAYCATGDITGTVNVKNCEVSNCYINASVNDSDGSMGEAGVLVGRTYSKEIVKIDNCLVYGNYAYYNNAATSQEGYIPLYSGAVKGANSTVENSLVLGTAPYPTVSTADYTHGVGCFENVYTDQDLPTHTTYANTDIKKISIENIKGADALTQLPNLDWSNTWGAVEGGIPVLRSFYDGEIIEKSDDTEAATTDTWDSTYSEPTTTDDDGNIIITSAEELAWVVLKSGTGGAGKTYKVKDGITAFYMNENTADLTLEQVEDKLNGNNTNAWEYQGNQFQATLDGNGVTVYGLYSEGANGTAGTYGGLVPVATGTVAVKNLAVKNSYIGGYNYSSAIIGYASSSTGGLISLTVEKCVVTNNYIFQTRTADSAHETNYSVGAIGGGIDAYNSDPRYVTVKNCLVYGNELRSALGGNISGIFAYFRAKSTNVGLKCYQFTNLIISGAAPWSGIDNSQSRSATNFVSVYTDTDKDKFTYGGTGTNTGPYNNNYGGFAEDSVEYVKYENMQGTAAETNMDDLDWEKVWKANESGFPTLRIFSTDNDDGTDDGADDGTDDDTTVTSVDTWDGTIATAFAGGSGTMADPYIIETAEQLAYLALGADGSTGGKYYKVADGVEAFNMCGSEGITLDSTLEDVIAATRTGKNWSATYQSTVSAAFCGVFDGSFATVYNLYGSKESMGLFPSICGYENDTAENVTIKNITVKNSYFEATGSTYDNGVGGIFGKHTNTGNSYPITISKCAVINCYLANTNAADASYAGAIGGTVRWATAVIDDCLAADNKISCGTVSKGGLIGVAQRSTSAITASDCVVIGTLPYNTGTLDATIESTSFTDLVDPTSYTNIYTDQTVDSTFTGITTLTRDQMTGDVAVSSMSLLDWGSNWKTQDGSYPIPFKPVVPEGVWNGEVAAEYSDGDGTEENPFIIETVAQLYKMVKDGGEDASGNAAYFKVKDGVYDLYANPVEGMTSDEVKEYFADSTTYKAVWDPQSTEFNGNFDGNGVNIHGLYNVKAAAGAGVAFLPRVSNSKAFINNVQFSDCHFENTGAYSSGTSAAVLVGRSDNSTINFNNVAVCDSTAICAAYVAAVFVAQNGATVTIDTAFTSGNTLHSEYYYSESLTYTYEGILYGDTSNYLYTIKNSVFTETDEYMSRVHYNVSIKFENSYVAGLTASDKTGISVSEILQSAMIGSAAQTNMPDLDWTAWIITDSYPVITALHDLTYTQSGNNGHSITCADCELLISLEEHNYNTEYVCTLCAFVHSHILVDNGMDYDSTCVDDGVMNVKCEFCDYTSTRVICAKTHTFGDTNPATEGNCQTEATVAYKTCSICGLCFTPDADVTSTEPLDHIGTGYTARHDWVAQEPLNSECGSVSSIEYFKCSVCATYLVEGIMSQTEPTEIDGHTLSDNYFIGEDYHANICAVCGEDFNAQSHVDANNDSVCDICLWLCGEHVFDGASITLTDSIAVNYMINKNVLDKLGYDSLHIEFTLDNKDYTVSEYTVREQAEQGTYCVFTFDKIGPQHMSCIIYATLYATKDDVAYESKTYEYSVRKYCHNILEEKSDDENLRTLIVDLLNYGAQSQVYEQHNSANLANVKLTDTQKAWGTQSIPSLESHKNLNHTTIESPSVTWMAGGLYLGERATLRFTIKAQDISNLTVEVKCGEKTWKISSSEFVLRNDVGNSDMYYVYINGINATQMRDIVYLTVYNGEEPASNTVSYSIESYVYSNKDSDKTSLKDLLICMIKYGDSAAAYANGQ